MRITIRSLLALLATTTLPVGLAACGGSTTNTTGSAASVAHTASAPASTTPAAVAPAAGHTTSTAPAATTGTQSAHGSSARTSSTPAASGGDESVQKYGSAASAADTAAVTTLVKSYYAAAAAGNGAAACSLMAAKVQSSIKRTLGRSPLLHGKGCAGVLALIFHHPAGQAGGVSADVSVTGVRVNGDQGFALIKTKSIASGEIPIDREGSNWKVGALIGTAIG